MNRRQFLFTAGAVAAHAGHGLLAPPPAWARSKADHTLRIAPVSFELAAGKTIRTVGYNGTVPGPLLRLKEGKKVTIDIFNDTDTPELVHWHGLPVPATTDGAEEQGSPFVPPHGHLQVSFVPTLAGTRWYHTHASVGTKLTCR